MKNRIMVKLTSSKFWAYLSVFVISVLILFGVDSSTNERVAAMIVALGNCIVYTCGNISQKNIGKEKKENVHFAEDDF